MLRSFVCAVATFLVCLPTSATSQSADFDSLSLAGSVASALGPEFRMDSGPLRIVIHRTPGWPTIVGDSIARRFAGQLAVGEDTVGAMNVVIKGYERAGDTVVVQVFKHMCGPKQQGMNYWSVDFELVFRQHGSGWDLLRNRWLGVADGICTHRRSQRPPPPNPRMQLTRARFASAAATP